LYKRGIGYFTAAPLPFIQLLVAAAVYVIIAGVCLAPDRRLELRFHQDRWSLNFNGPLGD